jgi:hypothetical protein
MSQENLEVVRRTMDAYNARDLTTYLAASQRRFVP